MPVNSFPIHNNCAYLLGCYSAYAEYCLTPSMLFMNSFNDLHQL